jgi:hypothetical protein
VLKNKKIFVVVSYCANVVDLETTNSIYFSRVRNLQYSCNAPSIKMPERHTVACHYKRKKAQGSKKEKTLIDGSGLE